MEHRGRAVSLVGVEVDDQHLRAQPRIVQHLRRQRDVGIHAEPSAPTGRRVVVAAAQIDGNPVFEGLPGCRDRSAGGVPHRPQDPPIDHPAGQPTNDWHLKDASQYLRASQRAQILKAVNREKLSASRPCRAVRSLWNGADRARSGRHEYGDTCGCRMGEAARGRTP